MNEELKCHCSYNDCGWCYAPEGTLDTTSEFGACNNILECPQSIKYKQREDGEIIMIGEGL